MRPAPFAPPSDTDPSSSTTVWDSCRPLIEKDLGERGFSCLIFVSEFPDLPCAELTGVVDGRPRTVLVACQQQGQTSVTLPCPDHPADPGSEELPCSLLVLQLSGIKGAVAEAVRFEQEWHPDLGEGEPVIMKYHM